MPSEGDHHEHSNSEFSDTSILGLYVGKPLLLNLKI